MRSSPYNWMTLWTKLGFKRKKARKREYHRKLSRFESLEKRELLSINQSATLDAAPLDYALGHFTLTGLDWTDVDRQDDRLMTTADGLGVSSSASDPNPAAFDPGEQWLFRFDEAGQLMGIEFREFTAEDADRALLTVGTQEPFIINGSEVGRGGFWQAPRPIQFNVGETLRLEALAPGEAETKEAIAAREASNAARVADGLEPIEYTAAPAGVWQVVGLQVLGRDEHTEGGFISLGQEQKTAPTSQDVFEGDVPAEPGYVLSGADAALFQVTTVGNDGQPRAVVSVAEGVTLASDRAYSLEFAYHDGQQWSERQLLSITPVDEKFLADDEAARKDRAQETASQVDDAQLADEINDFNFAKRHSGADAKLTDGDYRGALADLGSLAKSLLHNGASGNGASDAQRADLYAQIADAVEQTIVAVSPYRETVFERGKPTGKALENVALVVSAAGPGRPQCC